MRWHIRPIIQLGPCRDAGKGAKPEAEDLALELPLSARKQTSARWRSVFRTPPNGILAVEPVVERANSQRRGRDDLHR